jgi:acyl-CoA thioesterase-1
MVKRPPGPVTFFDKSSARQMGAIRVDVIPVSNMKQALKMVSAASSRAGANALPAAMLRSWLMVVLVGLALGLVSHTGLAASASASAMAAEQGKPPAILVLGDSLSAAYGVPLDQGWVSLLQARLNSAGLPHRVVNASVSGDTVAGGLSRLPGLLEQHAPALVIVALGGNDGLRGFTPAQTAEVLDRIIALARESGAEVLLVGVRLPPNYGTAYTERFQRMYQQVAERNDVALVPRLLQGIAEEPTLMQPDGVHPVAAAQPRMLDNIWAGLAPMLGVSR